jgi:hypothetical protein
MFSPADLVQLHARGISVGEAETQIAQLRQPPPPVRLDRPCTAGDGIIRLESTRVDALAARGRAEAARGRVTKFVPASGAATRMFKDLIAALHAAGARPSTTAAAREFFEHLDRFPFARELRAISGVGGAPASEEDERRLLLALLEGLHYNRLPKGLVAFHRTDRARSAFEEHLLEATRYAKAADGTCRVHFTVAPEFRGAFVRLLDGLRADIEERRGVRLDVTFSEQRRATDTLALDSAGEPFRDTDGSLLFRPSGHGALLSNLQQLAADLVVIKNIDNVLPDESSDEVVRWKQVLLGMLADLQSEVFARLAACADPRTSASIIDEAAAFAATRLSRAPATPKGDLDSRRAFVRAALDRPLRVCGVVRNEGEPGGAPFWVTGRDGARSLQIVEAFQVAAGDDAQARIFRAATHFNPVDIVCGVRSRAGTPFDLAAFVDPATSFVSRKSFTGRDLLALERPGLWNGAMAGWNTVFVEVPTATFAPVKTVFDLLRPEHQPRSPGVSGTLSR